VFVFGFFILLCGGLTSLIKRLGGGRLIGQWVRLMCLCSLYSLSGRLFGPRFGWSGGVGSYSGKGYRWGWALNRGGYHLPRPLTHSELCAARAIFLFEANQQSFSGFHLRVARREPRTTQSTKYIPPNSPQLPNRSF